MTLWKKVKRQWGNFDKIQKKSSFFLRRTSLRAIISLTYHYLPSIIDYCFYHKKWAPPFPMYNLPAIWQKRGYLNIGKGAWCQKLDLRTCRLRPVRRRLCPLRSTCIHMHWHHRGVIPLKYLLRVQRINLLHSHQMNLLKHSSLLLLLQWGWPAL